MEERMIILLMLMLGVSALFIIWQELKIAKLKRALDFRNRVMEFMHPEAREEEDDTQ